MKTRKPNFFIIGAPKCGTTSLKAYLTQHPDIFVPPSPPGEPHFFLPECKRKPLDMKGYLSLFDAGVDCKRAGEKSVWYLYDPYVSKKIIDFNPESDIIVMLRSPVDMLYSLHAQLWYNQNEDIEDFSEALKAEKERKEGCRLPPGCLWPSKLFYREVARFSVQVERYFEVFGREKVLVLIFDDFVRDTAAAYAQVLRFLNVDDSFQPDFGVQNPNTKPRSKRLMFLRHNYPKWVREVGRVFLPSQKIRNGIMGKLTELNTRVEKRPPMDPELRSKLQEEFRPEVERLSELLGRDLMYWVED